MAKITDIQVYELTADWKFEITKSGASGFRRFISKNAYTTEPYYTTSLGKDPVWLPNVGDQWSEEFTNCRCSRIEVKYITDCPFEINGTWEYKIFDCYYEPNVLPDTQDEVNEDGDKTAAALYEVPEKFITNIEIGGQFIQNKVSDADVAAGKRYKWFSDGTNCEQAVNFVVSTTNFKLQKEVTEWDIFWMESIMAGGHVNSIEFMGCSKGTLLYHGANLVPYCTETGDTKYRAELSFEHRLITFNDDSPSAGQDYETDGWNFILREKRANSTSTWYDRPYWVDGSGDKQYLYAACDFNAVMQAGVEISNIPALVEVNN